jgi:hypothetical protein
MTPSKVPDSEPTQVIRAIAQIHVAARGVGVLAVELERRRAAGMARHLAERAIRVGSGDRASRVSQEPCAALLVSEQVGRSARGNLLDRLTGWAVQIRGAAGGQEQRQAGRLIPGELRESAPAALAAGLRRSDSGGVRGLHLACQGLIITMPDRSATAVPWRV